MTEPTNEQVERALAFMRQNGFTYISLKTIPALLQAALNPPPEPSIKITDEMLRAADQYTRINFSTSNSAMCIGVYRAMAALDPSRNTTEPKTRARADQGFDCGTVFTIGGPARTHKRDSDGLFCLRSHRREGDPR